MRLKRFILYSAGLLLLITGSFIAVLAFPPTRPLIFDWMRDYPEAREAPETILSWLQQDKVVANAKPVTPFTTELFADSTAVRFLVVGDWGTGSGFQKKVANAMNAKAGAGKATFIISTGDNIYNNGVSSVQDSQWTTKFEQIYTGNNLQIPWYVVLGNHDHRGNIQAQTNYHTINPRWNLPARYYSFSKPINDQHSIEFFMLDTDPINRGVQDFVVTQKNWLRRSLQASRATWKIVVGHHPIRSHGHYNDSPVMLTHVKPLLDSNGVALYINGHDHDLQYLKAPSDSFYCLISGCGGGARNTSYGANTIFAATNGGFNYIAATSTRLYIEFVNNEGKTSFATNIRR